MRDLGPLTTIFLLWPLRAIAALLAFVAMLLAFGMFCCDGAADFVEGK